jgi:glycosyltransferase involved in cell wall biosynthesis
MPETRSVAERFGATHLTVSRRGAGAARNAGLMCASCEYIAFLDDDDVWLPAHIRPHLDLLEKEPGLDGVLSQITSVDQELTPLESPWPEHDPGRGDELVRTMLSGYYPQIGGTIVRARVRDTVGGFDEALLGDQDWDWQIRVARQRKLAYLPIPCVLFRQRPPGSYDALRLRRLGFARKVFLRHAIPERKVWPTLRGLTDAYRDVLWQYFDYFTDAAVTRARSGDKAGTRRALAGAIRTFPVRAAYHLVTPRPLREALFAAFSPKSPPAGPTASAK